MPARTTIADMLWLREQLRHLTSDDPTQPKRLQQWIDTAIRVRMAQRTKSKTDAHGALMGAYEATVMRWKLACEQKTNGYDSKIAEFRERHPMPTFKAFLIGSRQIGAGSKFCPLCGSPLDAADVPNFPEIDASRLDAIASVG